MLFGSLVKQLARLHSFLCVFLIFEKLFFIKLDSFLIDSRQMAIYKDLWTSFLDRSYRIFNPSSYLEFVSIASQQFFDPLRKFLSGQQILDKILIHRGVFVVDKFSTAPRPIHICQDLVLSRSRQISIHRDAFCINTFSAKLDFISFIISQQKRFFHLPNSPFSLKTSYPHDLRPNLVSNHLVCFSNPSFFLHFMHQTQVFGVFENF